MLSRRLALQLPLLKYSLAVASQHGHYLVTSMSRLPLSFKAWKRTDIPYHNFHLALDQSWQPRPGAYPARPAHQKHLSRSQAMAHRFARRYRLDQRSHQEATHGADCSLRQGARPLKGTYKGDSFTYFQISLYLVG